MSIHKQIIDTEFDRVNISREEYSLLMSRIAERLKSIKESKKETIQEETA